MASKAQSLTALATELPPLAVDARTLARPLHVSLRTIRSMDSAGKLPRPVRLNGRAVRWVLDGTTGIRAWLAAGSPDRGAWEALRRNGGPGR